MMHRASLAIVGVSPACVVLFELPFAPRDIKLVDPALCIAAMEAGRISSVFSNVLSLSGTIASSPEPGAGQPTRPQTCALITAPSLAVRDLTHSYGGQYQ